MNHSFMSFKAIEAKRMEKREGASIIKRSMGKKKGKRKKRCMKGKEVEMYEREGKEVEMYGSECYEVLLTIFISLNGNFIRPRTSTH